MSIGSVGVGASAASESVPAPPTAPLSVGTTTADGTWAVTAMGQLHDPLNTFWQLFFRGTGSSKWSLVTPPGVADNGGLTMADTGTALTVGVEPTNLLSFSPLAATSDGGTNWQAGLVPTGLAPVPDALAGQSGTPLLALVRRSGGQVLAGTGTGSRWTVLVSRSTLQKTAGSSCTISRLSAVATTASGTPLVGAACSGGGQVGVFAAGFGRTRWITAGPRFVGTLRGTPTTVLRLATTGSRVAALVAADGPHRDNLVAMWQGIAVDVWTLSPPLTVPRGAAVRSTTVGPSGTITVLLGSPGGPSSLWQVTGPGHPWVRLPTPPPSATTVTESIGGALDGFAVHLSRLTIYELQPGTKTWVRTQSLDVPIEYGSSS